MRRSLIVIVFFSHSFFLSGQDLIKKYVQNNIVPISSIRLDDNNLSEFDAMGKAIGDARIVMLGEQDHGDAPTFIAKTKLIKYLHEQKGFNVLAFESDFFATNYDWEYVKMGEKNFGDYIKTTISPVWTYCDACRSLFNDYLPSTLKTGNPIIISGFDSQMSSSYLMPLLDSVIRDRKLPITQLAEYSTKIIPSISTWYVKANDSSAIDKIVAYLTEIKNQLIGSSGKDDFWTQTVESMIPFCLSYRTGKKDYWKNFNLRDAQMAANLKWLAETKYREEKIIVWAHNYHISKYSGHYAETFADASMTMGTVFTNDSDMSKQTYIIGFTSYQGTAGRIHTAPIPVYKVDKPKSNSFENWVDRNYEYAFVDFAAYNKVNPSTDEMFYMSGSTLGNNKYHSNYSGKWNKVFDGVFYVKNMYPCAR